MRCRRENCWTTSGRNRTVALGTLAMVSLPARRSPSAIIPNRELSISSSNRRSMGNTSCPAGLNRTCRVLR